MKPPRFLQGAFACSLVLSPAVAAAAEFDGSSPLLCALSEAMECSPTQDCQRIHPEEVGAPDFFLVDVAAKTVQGLGGGGRKSAIRSVTMVDGKIVLQGAEDGVEGVRDGLGWSAAITQDQGRLVLSASGEGVAFVVFGACVALVDLQVLPE